MTIKCNTDVEVPEDTTVDLTDIPVKDVKESEERNVVADAVVAAEEKQKVDNTDIPQAGTAKNYFLEKISQFASLYDDNGQDPAAGRRIQAIARYFRDPTSTSKKWSNEGDVVIYGGLNTGVKFSAYLEYFVLPVSKRPKITPPYFDLLMMQLVPFINEEEVELTSTDSFGMTTPAACLPEPDMNEPSDERYEEFLHNVATAYKHSAANARQCAIYAFAGAFRPTTRKELKLLIAHLDETLTAKMKLVKQADTDRKRAAIQASAKRTAGEKLGQEGKRRRRESAQKPKARMMYKYDPEV